MPGCETNDLAEKLLIDLAENVGGKHGEFIRALGIIEPVDDVLKRLVVNGDVRGELIRLLVPFLFSLKMEQAGVIPVVSLAE